MRVEKTIFISYRRTNVSWALAVYQYLSKNGYDVFFDFTSINNGDFEQIILGNIKSRAHFLVILTPSALERVNEPNDWLRREIETALDTKRNIIPVFFEGFNFGSPSIAKYLTGKLATLSQYNGVDVPVSYFEEAMARICNRYLNTPIDAVLHPASTKAQAAAVEEKKAANKEGTIAPKELTAHEWYEKGIALHDSSDEEISCYDEAIRLKPDYAVAYSARGFVRGVRGDYIGAIEDCNIAISFGINDWAVWYNRGLAKKILNDFNGAISDFNQTVHIKPDDSWSYRERGDSYRMMKNYEQAIKDATQAITIDNNNYSAYGTRAAAYISIGEYRKALADAQLALLINPNYTFAKNQLDEAKSRLGIP